MFSTEGQEDVIKDGYYPITNQIASEAMEALGI